MQTTTYTHAGVFTLRLNTNDAALINAVEELLGLRRTDTTITGQCDFTIHLERLTSENASAKAYVSVPWTPVGPSIFAAAIGNRLGLVRVDLQQGIAEASLYFEDDEHLAALINKTVVRPLRLLLASRGWYFVHAGLLEQNGRSVLICGPSGSGKTMLSLALNEAGLQMQADDECYLQIIDGVPHAFGLPRQLGLLPAHLSVFPRFTESSAQSKVYSGFKSRLPFISVANSSGMPPVPVRLIVAPEYSESGENTATEISASNCCNALVEHSHCGELKEKSPEIGFANLCAFYELAAAAKAYSVSYNASTSHQAARLIQEMLLS